MEVLVCDVCLNPAAGRRVIDVCSSHQKGPISNGKFTAPQGAGARKGSKHPKVKCDFCEVEAAPQGMVPHVRAMHPDKFPKWWAKRHPESEAQ